MTYDYINENEMKLQIAQAIIAREQEIFSYQFNIDNYTSIINSLPEGDWPEDIAMYKNVTAEQLPESLTMEEVELINDYNYRDRLKFLIRTETMERNKSQRIFDAMKQRLSAEELATLVAQIRGIV